ncbi:MAG: endoflagellar motor protein [Deltaproteobacteria bacterium]|nr:MAG: endoflagellar motor protein [Deltaproteobacteria bacterium]
MKRNAMLAFVTLVLLGGCVTKGTYNELKAEYDDYKTKAEDRDQKNQAAIKDLEKALAEEHSRYDALAAEQARLESRIEALNAEKAKLLTDKKGLEAAEAEMREALDEMMQRKAQAEARIAEYTNLLERFKALIDSGKLKVRIIDGQMVVELATDVLFGSGSADLSRAGKDAVTEVTAILASIPDRSYQVAGHTDNVPIRSSRFRSNWELAFERAYTVVRTMIDGGMPTNRIAATSYGEFRPTASNDTDEGKALNRRIEIIVVPDLSKLPGAEELQKLGGSES